MLHGAVAPSSSASASILLADAGLGKIRALSTFAGEPGGSPELCHVRSLRGLLDALRSRTFECVMVDLALTPPSGESGPRTMSQEWEEIRARAGEAAVVALLDEHAQATAYPWLADLTDEVLTHAELAAGVHRAADRVLRHVRLARELSRAQSTCLELETELIRAFMHDGLTGLPNRAALLQRLSGLMAASRADGAPVAVLFCDLDSFKRVNEAQGHVAGDRVLHEIAARLSSLTRPEDTVARLGGDEFVLLCPGTDTPAAAQLAQRVIELLGRPVRSEGRDLHLSASVGIAVSPPLETGAEDLLRHADAAMREAKSRGPARSQVFDVAFADRSREELRLADDLRRALTRSALDLHYQPVVELGSNRLVALEALARWEHPVRGTVPPDVFVPIAEQQGFVRELDQWVVTRACRELRAALDEGILDQDVRVAVNLSAHSLGDPGLVRVVNDALRASGLPPDALVLEITETALMQDTETACWTLEGLRTLGVGVSLDDFGTGYSSLSFLRRLPVTQVKIDRSFVTNVVDNGEDLLITQSVIELARGLGLETVAEGVETDRQLAILRTLGCATGQGYLWSRPAPLDVLLSTVPALKGSGRAPLGAALTAVPPPPARSLPAAAGVLPAIASGVADGEAWLVIARTEHRRAVRDALGPAGTGEAVTSGRYAELDAEDTLRRILRHDGTPDPGRFEDVVGSVVRRLQATGRSVHVYGELAGLLLRREAVPAALAVEELWSGLRGIVEVHLWCGFDPEGRAGRDHAAVCTRHRHVSWQPAG